MKKDISVGIGILGCGVIGETHMSAIKKVKGGCLVAVCDADPDKAKKTGEGNQVDYYTNLKDMLKRNDLHLVCLCTPSSMHPEQAIQAAEKGKHVLTEKPMATTLRMADKMIETCHKRKVKLGVVYQRRLEGTCLSIKKALEKKVLGKMILGDCYLKYYRSPEYYKSASWRGTWRYDGGGCLMNQGIHMIDILQWFMGPVDTIYGHTETLRHKIEVEDTAVATLKFKNGALGMIEGTTSIYTPIQQRLELHGEKGSILIEGDKIKRWVLLGEDGKETEMPLPKIEQEEILSTDQAFLFGHYRIIQEMINSIKEDKEPPVSGEEGRKALEIILAIYRSGKTGKPVRLPL